MKTTIALFLLTAACAFGQRSTLTALNPVSNGTNFIVDFNVTSYLITATNNVNFLQTTNRSASNMKTTTVIINAGTTNWTTHYNPNWPFASQSNSLPTILSSNKISVVTFRNWGTNETNVFITHHFQ